MHTRISAHTIAPRRKKNDARGAENTACAKKCVSNDVRKADIFTEQHFLPVYTRVITITALKSVEVIKIIIIIFLTPSQWHPFSNPPISSVCVFLFSLLVINNCHHRGSSGNHAGLPGCPGSRSPTPHMTSIFTAAADERTADCQQHGAGRGRTARFSVRTCRVRTDRLKKQDSKHQASLRASLLACGL